MLNGEVAIISDTHGLIRPELVRELSGVTRIILAGDIGTQEVLHELKRIAPVTAVRGNVDKGAWADKLPETEVLALSTGVLLYILHDIGRLDLDAHAAGFAAVIYGHSHKAFVTEKEGVLFINPGSAGPRRFSLPVTFIRASIASGKIYPRIITLTI